MNKIITVKDIAVTLASRHHLGRIVLAGGCFDILHAGHLAFLSKAKAQGDTLIILLESDEMVRKRKGEERPIHDQNTRAKILAAVKAVDLIIVLPPHMTDHDYDTVVLTIKPAIIATTSGDPGTTHKHRQAQQIHAQVVPVMQRIPDHATSILTQRIKNL